MAACTERQGGVDAEQQGWRAAAIERDGPRHLRPGLQAELAAARDSEPNPEELEKYIKERFGGRRWGGSGGCGGCRSCRVGLR